MICCANGMATSLLIRSALEAVLDKAGVKPEEISHCALTEKDKAEQYDVVLCTQHFSKYFEALRQQGKTIIVLKSILSVRELEEKLAEHGII